MPDGCGWPAAVEAYVTFLRSGGVSPGTVRLRRHYLGLFARRVGAGPWQVGPDELAGFLAEPGWAPETRKSARSTLRGFYAWAEDTGRVDRDPARRLPAVRVPAGLPRPAPEQVVIATVTLADPRTALMVRLGALAGLRCGEIARVHTRDVTVEGLRVTGKGGRTRVVPLADALRRELLDRPAGWVFPGLIDGHLSPGHVSKLLERALPDGWTAHTLRHRFASRAYAGTRDLRAVQTLLGHSKPETTARYTLVPEDSLSAAVAAAAFGAA